MEMMANIKSQKFYLITLLIVVICSCQQKKGVWIPVVDKKYENALEIENDSIKLYFANYMGFLISIDSVFLKKGFVKQELNLGDVVNDQNKINSYKEEPIESIVFRGSDFSKKEIEKLYNLSLHKNDKGGYLVYNSYKDLVGEVTLSRESQNYELILIRY